MVQSRSLLDHVSVCLFSVLSSRHRRLGGALPPDRRQKAVWLAWFIKNAICGPSDLTTPPGYTFTALAQKSSRNKVSPWRTDSLHGILSKNDKQYIQHLEISSTYGWKNSFWSTVCPNSVNWDASWGEKLLPTCKANEQFRFCPELSKQKEKNPQNS